MPELANVKTRPHRRGRWLALIAGVLAIISLLIASQMKWFWWYGPEIVYKRDLTEARLHAVWCWPEPLIIGVALLGVTISALGSARRSGRLCCLLLLGSCALALLSFIDGPQSALADMGLLVGPSWRHSGAWCHAPREWWQNDAVSLRMVLDPVWLAAWTVAVIGFLVESTGVYVFRPPRDPERFVLCAFCRYNIRGVLGESCPECGEQIPFYKQELIREDLKKTAASQAAAANPDDC